LSQARTRKLEAESKLAGLQKDLAELGSVSGDQAGAEEAQTMQLHQVCFLLQCHDCINIMDSCTICLLSSSCMLAYLVYFITQEMRPKQVASYHHTPNCLRRHLVHAHDWHRISANCLQAVSTLRMSTQSSMHWWGLSDLHSTGKAVVFWSLQLHHCCVTTTTDV